MIDSNDESVVVLKGGNVRFKDVVLASHIPANFKPRGRFVHKDKTLDKYTMKIANSLGWQ